MTLNSTHGKLFSCRSRKEDLRCSVSKFADRTKVRKIARFLRKTYLGLYRHQRVRPVLLREEHRYVFEDFKPQARSWIVVKSRSGLIQLMKPTYLESNCWRLQCVPSRMRGRLVCAQACRVHQRRLRIESAALHSSRDQSKQQNAERYRPSCL